MLRKYLGMVEASIEDPDPTYQAFLESSPRDPTKLGVEDCMSRRGNEMWT
jgi:hypothetical protein